jgi:hypothetical protein
MRDELFLVAPGRWIVKSDGDGHWYIIPAESEDEFAEWRNHEEEGGWAESMFGSGPYAGIDFNKYRCSGDASNYVFVGTVEAR